MLIGLNGRLKSGKDTTYEMIRCIRPDAERLSFADLLKDSAAASIGMSRELLEWLKNEEDFIFTVTGPDDQNSLVEERLDELEQWTMTAREYMQWFGTEGHRAYFGDNFWVDAALPLDTDHSDRFIVVTDMRFPNEVQRIVDLGGITVKVERDSLTSFGDHPSEQNIDGMIDYFLDNNGTMEDLEVNVHRLFSNLSNLEAKSKSRRIHTHAQQLLER